MVLFSKLPVLLVVAALALAGCGKKEEQKATPPRPDRQPQPQPAPRKPTQVVVPESVRSGWKAVVISIKNKSTSKETRYTVPIGSALRIPDSDVTIHVNQFLPDFTMEGTLITSKTNEPHNPAARVTVAEGGRDIFRGWLFARYPTTHAFQHPKYGFTLVDYIKK